MFWDGRPGPPGSGTRSTRRFTGGRRACTEGVATGQDRRTCETGGSSEDPSRRVRKGRVIRVVARRGALRLAADVAVPGCSDDRAATRVGGPTDAQPETTGRAPRLERAQIGRAGSRNSPRWSYGGVYALASAEGGAPG